MEKLTLENDIRVLCVTARSFPEGIMEAFQTLERTDPSIPGRTFYGISRMQNGKIIYKAAAAEQYEGEAKKLGLEAFVIKKGEYLGETLHDFMKDTSVIGTTFQKLLAVPELDQTGACVEWYKSDRDVLCMVRLNDPEK